MVAAKKRVLITNPKQFGVAPAPRTEEVELPEFKNAKGEIPFVLVYQVTAQDHADIEDSKKIYRDGEVVGFDESSNELRVLAITMRDENNNRLWPDVDDAISQLKDWPLSVIRRLVTASNKVMNANPVSAEKNSDETQSESSPSS